jgi:rhodanese-related sulfurtransferase
VPEIYGTATLADNDYQPSTGTLVFANGESAKTISVTVNGDTRFESLEKLSLTLSSPQNAVLFRARATGSILNDDEHPNTALPLAGPFTITGPGANGGGVVKVFNSDGSLRLSMSPYGPGYKGSIRVAQGDVNGDGVADLITAPGPGAPPHVMAFDGVTLGQITSYYAFAPQYLGGVNLATGDLDCDGRDEVIAAIGTKNLVDVRSPDEFSGKILAPAHLPQEQSQRPGHIPGAINVPWSRAANEDGTFKSDEQLAALYAAAGLDGEKETIAYCRIGERSSHTWFVLQELLGHRNVKNYDGSWTEYGSLVGAPIELGS